MENQTVYVATAKTKIEYLGTVTILVGVYTDEEEAEKRMKEMDKQGYRTIISETKIPYDDYCKKIREAAGESKWGFYAYRVKIADMKDHLSQTETLTEKLKAKYLSALRYLL